MPLIRIHQKFAALESFVERGDPLLVAALATLLHSGVYFVPNRYPVAPPVTLALTGLDVWIPFVPSTVWIYLSDYILLFIAFQSAAISGRALPFLRGFLIALFVATATHLIFPIAYPRNLYPITSGDALSDFALRTLRSVDAATSCMPSLHVALAVMAASFVPWHAPWGRILKVWTLLVALATLTTKQHYVYDVLAGASLGILAYRVARRRIG